MTQAFYTVTFETKPSKRTCSATPFFRLMNAPLGITHDERMAVFQEELGDMFDITSYDLDMEARELSDLGITRNGFRDTYWDRALQGAV